ncbi:MAG: exonuclease domain-containing protein [Anaerolineales bacterium]|jgi:DNA polymerase-3 subunit epsilon
MYSIIDIETTGGSPVSERITEIAIYIHDGEKVTGEFVSLINPEKKIPYHITSLTGISNAMVAEAPKFYEVAKQIVEITSGCVFVAHNVTFDYHFIRNEFKRLGYVYSREKLCTVQLSRKLIPGLNSYSLGKLCRHVSIEINGRHRAAGDAYATVKLFEYLMSLTRKGNQVLSSLPDLDKKDLHPNLSPEKIHNLPESAGVYYFYNDEGDLVYIGKSKQIRSRVLSHFRNFTSKKAIDMRNAVADISYELTGSELIALLKESHEIKQYKPRFNRAQRRALNQYGLYHYRDKNGYDCYLIAKNAGRIETPLSSFATQKAGKDFLQNMVNKYRLCQKLCGLYPASGSCFHYEISECDGACIGKEIPDSYNARARKVIDEHQFHYQSFFILDKGRVEGEIAVVMVHCGKYAGYGYIDEGYYAGNLQNLKSCVKYYDDNRDIQQIIRRYIRENLHCTILPYTC